MKKFIISTTLLLLLATVTSNAMWPWGERTPRDHKHQPISGQPSKPVGAPLDGGLLLLLGSAGVAYYSAKKYRSIPKDEI